MLSVAESKFSPTERVEFRSADATDLPFPNDIFDAVVSQFGMMFYPDKDKSYREVHRVLAPGGRYLFSVWDSHFHNPFGRFTHEIVGGFFPDDSPQFYKVPFSYRSIDIIKASLIDAGFTAIRIDVVKLEKEIGDLAKFARGIVFGNPLIAQIQSRGGVEPEVIAHRVTVAFGSAFPDGKMPLQAIMVEAAKV